VAGFEWYPCGRLMFLFRCVLEFRCGWVGVVSVWQAEVLVSMCVGVSVWLVGVVSVWQAEVLVSMCVGVSVWLGWGGIRVAG